MEDQPKIYVACLAAYNSAISYGTWLKVPDSVEELHENIQAMLKKSPMPGAEEWAIHDSENFDPFCIEEYETLESIVVKSNIIRSIKDFEIDAFQAWEPALNREELKNGDEHIIINRFHDEYLGEYESGPYFAEEHFENRYDVPNCLATYVDYNKMWADREIEGYYARRTSIATHIFRPQC